MEETEETSAATVSHENLTERQLRDLEAAPKTKKDKIFDRVICALPIIMGIVAVCEYLYVPNYKQTSTYTITYNYVYFLGFLILLAIGIFIASLFSRRAFDYLRYHAPFYTLVFVLLTLYDLATLKFGLLTYPYFPWVDNIICAAIEDTDYLLDCAKSSLILLFTGYFTGAILGVLTGIACGYSKQINYWIDPFLKLLGAIPSTTWIPVAMVIAASLWQGAVFIIALGVWFATAIATITGIRNIDKSYYEAARTLGAKSKDLVLRIAIPSALPSIFQGLTQAMSSACMALMVAEMIGVESGLGWYITWQKAWAQYDNMYASIVVICLIFVLVNFIMNRIKAYVLRWQEGVVK